MIEQIFHNWNTVNIMRLLTAINNHKNMFKDNTTDGNIRQIISPAHIRHRSISWSIFTKFGAEVTTPKSKNEFIGGQYHTTPSPSLPLKTPF